MVCISLLGSLVPCNMRTHAAPLEQRWSQPLRSSTRSSRGAARVTGRIVNDTVALVRLDVGKPCKLRRTTLTSTRSHKRRQSVHGEDSDFDDCFARRVRPHEPCGQPTQRVTAAASAPATAAPATAADKFSHRLAHTSHHQGRRAQLHGTGDATRATHVQIATDDGRGGPGRL